MAIMQGSLPSKIPDKENNSLRDLWAICNSCWNADPTLRPSMSELKSSLEGMHQGPMGGVKVTSEVTGTEFMEQD